MGQTPWETSVLKRHLLSKKNTLGKLSDGFLNFTLCAKLFRKSNSIWIRSVWQRSNCVKNDQCDVIKMREIRGEVWRKPLKKRWLIPHFYDVTWIIFWHYLVFVGPCVLSPVWICLCNCFTSGGFCQKIWKIFLFHYFEKS